MSQEIKIIRKTDFDLVVFKPANMASELSNDIKGNSAVAKIQELLNLKEKPKLPHRIDRVTQGLLLMTLNDDALRFYNEEIKSGLWEKYYLAKIFLDQNKSAESIIGIQKAYLKENDGRSFVVKSGGKPSFLEIITVERLISEKNSAVALIKLLTGRHHQIRIMMANLGFPLVDDFLYNTENTCFSGQNFYLEHLIFKYRDFASKEKISLLSTKHEPSFISESFLEKIEKIAYSS